jgi:hypothetical protein
MGLLRLAVIALVACNAPRDAFECTSNASCRNGAAAGTCESTGFCSFPDPTCSMGSRYGTGAGAGLAGQCVGAIPGDGGTDATDGPIDGNDNAAPHMLGAWGESVAMSAPRYTFASAVDGNFLFVIGGINGSTNHSDVQVATLNPNAILPSGAISTWNATTALPADKRTLTAAYDSGYLYIFGGVSDSSERAEVLSATVDASGNVGTWTPQSALPETLRCTLAASSGHYVYVIGGKHAGNARANVYRGILSAGTVAWDLETSLDISVSNGVAVVANGYLYVIGGCGGGTNACNPILDTVEFAKINADGTVGAFQHTTMLPTPRSHHTAAAATGNGDIYVLGGKYGPSTNDPSTTDVIAAHQHADGTLGAWSPVASTIDANSRGNAAVVGKFLVFIQTTSQVAQIQ